MNQYEDIGNMNFESNGVNDPVGDMLRFSRHQNMYISLPTRFPPLPPKGKYAPPDSTQGQWERADAKHWYTPATGHHSVVPQRPSHVAVDSHVYGFAGTGKQMLGLHPYAHISMPRTAHMKPTPAAYPYEAHVFRGQDVPRSLSQGSNSANSAKSQTGSARKRYQPLDDDSAASTPITRGTMSPGGYTGTLDMSQVLEDKGYDPDMPPLER